MEKKLFCSNLMKILSDYWVYVFCPLAVFAAVVSCVFCYTTTFALAVSLIIFITLLSGLCIDYNHWCCKKVKGKGVLKYIGFYSSILAIFHLLSYIISYQEEGIDCYFYAYLVSMIVCGILIIITIISINPCDNNAYPVVIFFFLILLVFFLPVSCENENIRIDDVKFSKEEFIPIQKWYKEVLNYHTVYVVVCEEGILYISPHSCPEIRDIHEGTKIKFLKKEKNHYSKKISYKRIEIQN